MQIRNISQGASEAITGGSSSKYSYYEYKKYDKRHEEKHDYNDYSHKYGHDDDHKSYGAHRWWC